jgi:hypothetical protein
MSEHYYTLDGVPSHTVPNKSKPGESRPTTVTDAKKLGLLPSVSAFLKVKNEAGLENWKTDQIIEACHSFPPNGAALDVYSAQVKEKAFAQVGAAADLGTEIHAALEAFYRDGSVPESANMADLVIAVDDKVHELNIEVDHAEKVLVNPAYGYAGTTDIMFSREDGTRGILDFKSKRTKPGKRLFSPDSHPMQIAAYWQAAYGKELDFEVPPYACGYNVYISTTELGRVEVVHHDDRALREAWAAFKACLVLYRYTTGYDSRKV